MIRIKDENVFTGLMLHKFDRKLVMVMLWLLTEVDSDLVVITESYRDPLHAGDVHSTDPVRALDLRSWTFAFPEKLAALINREWEYDPNRPNLNVAVYHKTSTGAYHFHIQVHPNTRRKQG